MYSKIEKQEDYLILKYALENTFNIIKIEKNYQLIHNLDLFIPKAHVFW